MALTQATEATGLMDAYDKLVARPLPVGAGELLELQDARLQGHRAVYLSTPITTGPRLLEALKHPDATREDGYLRQVRDEVIAANVRGVAPLRARIDGAFKTLKVIDPTELEVPQWTQSDYHRYWVEVIDRFVDVVVFADGWHISTGCTIEYLTASAAELPCLDVDLSPISADRASELLDVALEQLRSVGLDAGVHQAAVDRVLNARRRSSPPAGGLKDTFLTDLAEGHNVAAFVSLDPDLKVRHMAVHGHVESRPVCTPIEAISRLMDHSRRGSLNIRTFRSEPSKSTPFFYGLRSTDEVLAILKKQAALGYFTIVNETIDIHDGGVSGVSLGGLLEFAPDDTPRAVEGSGTAVLPVSVARRILSTVYSVPLDIPSLPGHRYEFSVHPQRVGHRRSHLVIWEVEQVPPFSLESQVLWPNDFSRLVGDKTYGLLLADACGARVPRTQAFLRRVAPFNFGQATGTREWWLRTAPAEQTPGHFTTTSHWTDPYELLAKEDPTGRLAGVLAQEGIDAAFSGATALGETGTVVEGVHGTGDAFMLGRVSPQGLPANVEQDVVECVSELEGSLGPIRIEWVHDGANVWVVQMHRAGARLEPGVLCPGDAEEWITYRPSDGLERLHEVIAKALKSASGIEVTERVGVTSHVGDLVRKAGVPTRFALRS